MSAQISMKSAIDIPAVEKAAKPTATGKEMPDNHSLNSTAKTDTSKVAQKLPISILMPVIQSHAPTYPQNVKDVICNETTTAK